MNSASTDSISSSNTGAPRRVLLTGSGGYLGRHLTARLRRQFSLRVLAVGADVPEDEEHPVEVIQGSVADSALVEKAVEGMDAVVIAHMAPNRDGAYASVDLPFSVNVQGAAAVFHAAARCNIRRAVLISSISVVDRSRISGEFMTADTVPGPRNLYALTKTLQEQTARFFHEMHGMEIAVLRPAYVISESPLVDKYGKAPGTVNWQFIDPEDIAEAAALGLTTPGIGFGVFYTLGGPAAEEHADLEPAKTVLGWKPKHRFAQYPVDA